MKTLTKRQRLFLSLTAVVLALVGAGITRAQENRPVPANTRTAPARPTAPAKPQQAVPTLDEMFPREGLYPDLAWHPSFSFNGKYAAFYHAPHAERASGASLWLMEMATGKIVRLAPKDKPAAKPGSPAKAGATAAGKAARPVTFFTWSPTANELLFISQGYLYRWKEEERAPVRETLAGKSLKVAQYLPDGTGYTYLYYNYVIRVVFSAAEIEELPLRLPRGEEPLWYQLSPDGKRLAVVTGKGAPAGGHAVMYASYRGRFVTIKSARRALAEDPALPSEKHVYLADATDPGAVRASLAKVFTYKTAGHRDVLSWPAWSPDSRKIAFALFEQASGTVQILQAETAPVVPGKDQRATTRPAGAIHRFVHAGGPNTPAMIQPRYLADSRRLVFLAEQEGFRHLYLLDPLSHSAHALTRGRFEVYPLAMSEDRQWYYVAATREDPACRDIYRVSLADGTMQRLTGERGVYGNVSQYRYHGIANIAVSPDGKTVLANQAVFGSADKLVRIDTTTRAQATVLDFGTTRMKKVSSVRPEFFRYQNRHGQDIPGFMFKPAGWKATDKRPLLIYVYGGPIGIRKSVMEGECGPSSYYFAYYMAQKHGYVTCVIDPRGSSGYGGDFEKANFGQPGKPQVEDLVDGVKFLVRNHGVDPKRVGIHGWSFGGFQTQMALYTAPDVFAVGIAGAGPTGWENYNGWYATGTIGKNRPGKQDLARFSLLPLAKNLKGRLLLVHGMEDDNVLFQDTVQVYRALLRAGKVTQVELFLDPTGNHGLGGDVTLLTLYRKYEEFLLRTLATGNGTPATAMPYAGKAA